MINKLKEFILFLRDIFNSRDLILQLSKNDFKVRYAGSYFGIIWAFIQPLITISVFWFVFEVGFRNPPIDDFPFILWLICGIIPWFFFSEALNNATSSLIEYNYLVKKVVFRTSILPIVKILASLFVHLFFVMFIFIMFKLYGFELSVFNLQIIYYLFSMVVLLLGLSWITSALIVFLKDIREVINVTLQIGFWITAIFWSYKIVPDNYLKLLKLNPMFYIVNGYRDTFINHIWFWEKRSETIYFWILTSFLFIVGAQIFRKLRPHFSDVL